jgi:hypothetical protein
LKPTAACFWQGHSFWAPEKNSSHDVFNTLSLHSIRRRCDFCTYNSIIRKFCPFWCDVKYQNIQFLAQIRHQFKLYPTANSFNRSKFWTTAANFVCQTRKLTSWPMAEVSQWLSCGKDDLLQLVPILRREEKNVSSNVILHWSWDMGSSPPLGAWHNSFTDFNPKTITT